MPDFEHDAELMALVDRLYLTDAYDPVAWQRVLARYTAEEIERISAEYLAPWEVGVAEYLRQWYQHDLDPSQQATVRTRLLPQASAWMRDFIMRPLTPDLPPDTPVDVWIEGVEQLLRDVRES